MTIFYRGKPVEKLMLAPAGRIWTTLKRPHYFRLAPDLVDSSNDTVTLYIREGSVGTFRYPLIGPAINDIALCKEAEIRWSHSAEKE